MTDVYDTYPPLSEILEYGGTPGIEYAYILGQNVVKAQKLKWETLHRVRAFSVAGPKGDVAMILMGRGKRIPGASPQGMKCHLWIDQDADRLLGLRSPTETPIAADTEDRKGRTFDPEIHEAEKDGTPILNADGTLRCRNFGRPRKEQATAPPG